MHLNKKIKGNMCVVCDCIPFTLYTHAYANKTQNLHTCSLCKFVKMYSYVVSRFSKKNKAHLAIVKTVFSPYYRRPQRKKVGTLH